MTNSLPAIKNKVIYIVMSPVSVPVTDKDDATVTFALVINKKINSWQKSYETITYFQQLHIYYIFSQ